MSGIVAYTEFYWRQDLVASDQIAAFFHVINNGPNCSHDA